MAVLGESGYIAWHSGLAAALVVVAMLVEKKRSIEQATKIKGSIWIKISLELDDQKQY